MRSIFNYTTKEHVDEVLLTLACFDIPVDYIKGIRITAPVGVLSARKLFAVLGISDPTERLVLTATLGVVSSDEQAFPLIKFPPWRGLLEPVPWDKVLHRLYLNSLFLKGVFSSDDTQAIYRALVDFYMELLQIYQPELAEDFMFTASEYTP